MKFEHDKSWDNFETVFNSRLPIKNAWNKIIDFHEQTSPNSYWSSLRNLDVESEQKDIKEWLEQLVTHSPVPNSVVALWLGITKFLENSKEVYVIYLIGSDAYNNNDIDWATEPTYEPENKYGILGVLNQIDSIIKTGDKDDYSFLDWILPLAYCALTIDEIIRTKLEKKLFLKSRNKLFVSTGHDDGDYKELSPIE